MIYSVTNRDGFELDAILKYMIANLSAVGNRDAGEAFAPRKGMIANRFDAGGDRDAGVKTIGEYAFHGCTSLESVTIPRGMDPSRLALPPTVAIHYV